MPSVSMPGNPGGTSSSTAFISLWPTGSQNCKANAFSRQHNTTEDDPPPDFILPPSACICVTKTEIEKEVITALNNKVQGPSPLSLLPPSLPPWSGPNSVLGPPKILVAFLDKRCQGICSRLSHLCPGQELQVHSCQNVVPLVGSSKTTVAYLH